MAVGLFLVLETLSFLLTSEYYSSLASSSKVSLAIYRQHLQGITRSAISPIYIFGESAYLCIQRNGEVERSVLDTLNGNHSLDTGSVLL